MDCKSTYLPYEQTGFFSAIVLDYLNGKQELAPFFAHPVSVDGIKAAIAARQQYPGDRELLKTTLQKQYDGIKVPPAAAANMALLGNNDCFTITTAHQPNIFTGHLYFIYKIMHVIRLATDLKAKLPAYDFVPVFYMGSEDADLEELGHININGEKHEWKTNQTGAVGRMKVDKALLELIGTISGQLTTLPFGKQLVELLRDCYQPGVTIESATFKLIHELFGSYGLVVLLPDNAGLKKSFLPVIEKELNENFSYKAVEETVKLFPETYKVQAAGRELNLFYLEEGSRERLERIKDGWSVVSTGKTFTEAAMAKELKEHPERFSPNVILRPVFQEMILPNLVFVGGGGEIAYWLELKKVFEAANVPYPVLVLRNSFLVVNKEQKALAEKLEFKNRDLFKPEQELINELVKRESELQLDLSIEKLATENLYAQLKKVAAAIDPTLGTHAEALKTQTLKKINELEKKMLKLEKRKFEAQQRQVHKLKSQLFPGNSLQERIDNLLPFYAKWGQRFINGVYDNSLGLEQQFTVLVEC